MTSVDTPGLTRYAQLARLLVRHGRSDLLAGSQLEEFAPLAPEDIDPITDDAQARATRFAQDLEALGPTYIKLGQLLSTRFDLLPPAYTTALATLQDHVEPFGADQARQIIEEDLGVRVRAVFEDFDDEPIGAASLGQVHRARLRTGRQVVVKVQRPTARDQIREDMVMLTKLAELADARTSLGRQYGFGPLLAQFRRSLAGELDYRREARNLTRFGDLVRDYDLLLVPQPVPELCSGRVLTMDEVVGRKVTDVGPLALMDYDTRPIVEQLFRFYLRSILDEGVLHADPHPGNLMLTSDGRLALLDLGMVATVSPRLQSKVIKLLLSIGDGDGEEAALVLSSMGHPLDGFDPGAFRSDVTHLVSEAVGAGADVQAGTVLVELSRLSGTHQLRPPAEMAMIGKALLNLDQATMHLDPSFAPAEAIQDNVSQILAGGLKVSTGGLVAAAMDAKEFTTQLPKRANVIMDNLAEGEFSMRVKALDEERLHTVLQRVANRLTLGMIIAATVVGAALLMRVPSTTLWFGYPAIAMFFFLLAVLAGIAMGVWIVATDAKVAKRARGTRTGG